MNKFGRIFTLTTFGESHGPAMGGILDGVPSGYFLDEERIQKELNRRRPGSTSLGTTRREPDRVTLLSGVFEGRTLGTPIGFVIPNTAQRPADYSEMQHLYRPSHADFTYEAKYGLRDWRGGGRASARETVSRVAAGAIARQIIEQIHPVSISAFTQQIGPIMLADPYPTALGNPYKSPVRTPEGATEEAAMIDIIKQIRSEGDTVGGRVGCIIRGVPAGLGEPVAEKLQALLAETMMSIPAAKGFEYGMGMRAASSKGSEVADIFCPGEPHGLTVTNYSGGIQGGISNGSDIYFSVAFKPAPTMMRDVQTIDNKGNECTLHAKGRHDACVVPRAVSVVESMACLVMLDAMLMYRSFPKPE